MYKNSKDTCEYLQITRQTLKSWKDNGIISYKKLNSKKFLYDVHSVKGMEELSERQNVIYARVSNTKQNEDLDRQVKFLTEFMIANGVIVDKVYKDIASGMNENRTDFNKLIQDVIDGKISKVYISYKDRFIRFGFNIFQYIFNLYGVEIVTVNLTKEEDFQQELTEDFISILHHFSMKMYSNRRKMFKELENKLKE